ncbi:MAG: hypothetical protein JWM41_254 [Gemmatimonadetes bacterium]|nr:hypothetical protein [Gemmatimonadota bacterium]
MDGLKGFAEVAKHILYETFGLLIPGGLGALTVVAAVAPSWLALLLAFARANPWLALGGAYVLGYLVQALSRPANAIGEWILQSPSRLIVLAGRLVPELARRAASAVASVDHALTGRHKHSRDDHRPRADFDAIIEAYWKRRLGLAADATISDTQTRNLSFSQLIGERDGLDRFRAATSLTRAASALAAIVMAILLAQVLRAERELTWQLTGVVELLVIVFYGALERADMYDDLWRSSLKSQFLCAVSRAQPLDPYIALEARVEPDAIAACSALARTDAATSSVQRTRSGSQEETSPNTREAEREGRGGEPPPDGVSTPFAKSPTPIPLIPTTTPAPLAPQENSRVSARHQVPQRGPG